MDKFSKRFMIISSSFFIFVGLLNTINVIYFPKWLLGLALAITSFGLLVRVVGDK